MQTALLGSFCATLGRIGTQLRKSGRYAGCALAPLLAILAACGDGGAAPPSVGTAPPSAAGPIISAYLTKGPVTGASCTLRMDDGTALTGTSANGMVRFGASTYSGESTVECAGGTYVDEASGKTVKLTETLRTRVTLNNATKTAIVTPLTEIAMRLAPSSTSAFETQLRSLAVLLGMEPPQDFSAIQPGSTEVAAQEYQRVLTAIARYQKNTATTLGQFLDTFTNRSQNGLNSALRSAWNAALAPEDGVTAAMRWRLNKIRLLGSVDGLPAGQSFKLVDGAGHKIEISSNGRQVYFQLDPKTEYRLSLSDVPSGTKCVFGSGDAPQGVTAGDETAGDETAGDDIGNLDIVCSGGQYTLGGTVYGLHEDDSVALRSSTGETLILKANGRYSFELGYFGNTSYRVTALSPNSARCSIDWAQGKVLNAAVERVDVHCVPKDHLGRLSAGVIRAVDIVQSYSQPVGSPYQLLVPGRKALVRAFIYRTAAANPAVSLQVKNGQSKPLNCPTNFSLDTTPAAAAPIHRYDNRTVCTADLTAAEVTPGLEFDIRADLHTRSFKPLVSTFTGKLGIKIIPLTIGRQTARLPEDAQAQIEGIVLKHFPLSSVTVTRGSALAVSPRGNDAAPNSSAQWEEILQTLEKHRKSTDRHLYYFGFLPSSDVAGLHGMAYIGAIGESDFRSGIALGPSELPADWLTVFSHEFGHNLSLRHASCPLSGINDIDPFWLQGLSPIPWPELSSGQISPAALMDLPSYESMLATGNTGNVLIEPSANMVGGNSDLMSYCGGQWLSEYHYHKVASYVQAHSAEISAYKPARLQTPHTTELTHISGSISATGVVQLRPSVRSRQSQTQPNSGSHYILLKLMNGQEIKQYFTPVSIDHAPEVSHFSVYLALTGPVQSISVYKDGLQLLAPQPLP